MEQQLGSLQGGTPENENVKNQENDIICQNQSESLRLQDNNISSYKLTPQNVQDLNLFLRELQLGTFDLRTPGSNGEILKLGYDNPGRITDVEKQSQQPPGTPGILGPLMPPRPLRTPKSELIKPMEPIPTPNPKYPTKDTLHFNDGIRRIDIILSYQQDDLEFLQDKRRRIFLSNLVDHEDIDIEIASPSAASVDRTHYVKVHAPWAALIKYAEILNIKMPIKEEPPEEKSWWLTWGPFKKFDYNHDRIPPDPSFYMAKFSRRKIDSFLLKDQDTFFTSAQRSQIVWEILSRVPCGDSTWDKNGISRLLKEKAFLAAYPLHDGPYDTEEPNQSPCERRLLYTEWAHASNFYKRQPLGLIRKYFGDKVGLYFAWLGFYTSMLIPASVVGSLCLLFGILTRGTDYNTPSREICNRTGGEIVMCPLCGHCNLWPLDDSCTFSKLSYLLDNPATMFFAVFMAFWSTSFLEYWKRTHAVISWEWDLHSFEMEEEPRSEFEANVKTVRINPVTQLPEAYLPAWSKAGRMVVTTSIVLTLVLTAISVVIGIIIYRLVMISVLYTTAEGSYELIKDNARILGSVSASFMNLIIVVFVYDNMYYKIAIWLTDRECPRTQTQYEDSFTFKVFTFQFINYYSYLIYIAFFKGRFFRHPGDDPDNIFEKIRGDMCDPAGCLSELFIQLSIIMIGKQFFNNFMELLLPKMGNWLRRRKFKKVITEKTEEGTPVFLTRWEQDAHLLEVDKLELFEEYLEMVIQYGFVTLFVAAFPIAPVFALVNNIIEIRLDAYKWTTQLRRPLAERVEDIGAWFPILQGLTYCSFCSSAFVIAYTSDIIPRLVYMYSNEARTLQGYINSSLSVYPTTLYTDTQKNFDNVTYCRYRGYYDYPDEENELDPTPSSRYWHIMAARLIFVAIFEHLAFASTGIMAYVIPDVPIQVTKKIQKERALAVETFFQKDLEKLEKENAKNKLLEAENVVQKI